MCVCVCTRVRCVYTCLRERASKQNHLTKMDHPCTQITVLCMCACLRTCVRVCCVARTTWWSRTIPLSPSPCCQRAARTPPSRPLWLPEDVHCNHPAYTYRHTLSLSPSSCVPLLPSPPSLRLLISCSLALFSDFLHVSPSNLVASLSLSLSCLSVSLSPLICYSSPPPFSKTTHILLSCTFFWLSPCLSLWVASLSACLSVSHCLCLSVCLSSCLLLLPSPLL